MAYGTRLRDVPVKRRHPLLGGPTKGAAGGVDRGAGPGDCLDRTVCPGSGAPGAESHLGHA